MFLIIYVQGLLAKANSGSQLVQVWLMSIRIAFVYTVARYECMCSKKGIIVLEELNQWIHKHS